MFQTAKSLLILLMPSPSFFHQKSCSYKDSYIILQYPFARCPFYLSCFSWLSFEQLRGLAVPGLSLAAMLPFNPSLQSVDNPLLCTAWQSDPGLDDLKNYRISHIAVFHKRYLKLMSTGCHKLLQAIKQLARTNWIF